MSRKQRIVDGWRRQAWLALYMGDMEGYQTNINRAINANEIADIDAMSNWEMAMRGVI